MSRIKTLYVSDLDGTLLNKTAEISAFTEQTLCRLIENGLHFSIATARTAATVLHMISGLPMEIPIILMNGVSIYDAANSMYVKTHLIEKSSLGVLLAALKKHAVTGFMYTIENGEQSTFYEELRTPHMENFVEERIRKYGKRFTQIHDFSSLAMKPVVYFSVCEAKEKLEPLYEELRTDKKLNVEFYRDIYEEGFWYLEACSAKASKYNAIRFLREEYGFDRVVSFGDNLNDLPMFLASDESYAVANAKPEVKEKATGVIGGNDEDGVAQWLLQNAPV